MPMHLRTSVRLVGVFICLIASTRLLLGRIQNVQSIVSQSFGNDDILLVLTLYINLFPFEHLVDCQYMWYVHLYITKLTC